MKKLMAATMMASSLSLGACATYDDQQTLEGAGVGAAVGGALGAGAGAVIGGLSPVEGALIGAAIGGIAGAIWADRDGDGRVDGYYQNGTYYQGRPPENAYQSAPPPPPPPPVYQSGERG